MTIWIKLMFYIGYLFFGSFIFMEIEQPAKEQRCQEIENELFVNMVRESLRRTDGIKFLEK